MYKKIVLLLLCASLAGCAKGPSSNNSQSSNSSSSSSQEEQYNIVRPSYTPDYSNYSVSTAPSGINMTYYSDIYSRGFSWLTDNTVFDTRLYLVQSDKGEQADFTSAIAFDGDTAEITYEKNGDFSTEGNVIPAYPHKSGDNSSNDYVLKVNSHKVHVENLEKGKAYSYKIGSEQGWAYGAFIVEKDAPKELTAVHMSDAQTKDPSKLNVWRNTFTKAIETVGDKLDTVLYNGDQFDQNISKVNSSDQYKPNRLLSYAKAYDIIQDYKFNLPYMPSAGNHERTAPYSHYIMNDINYAGYDYAGAYYSYDYNFAHFVVLNSKSVTDEEVAWLQQDLASASNAKWKIVMMHISPYSTGDNSNSSENQSIVQKFTPIFSTNHVDLVLQAHDHTYNKTLPYKWDAAGYTTTWNNEEVVNFAPETETKDNIVYDKNPQGTYYVTTGAAGHRCGGAESDGVWSDVVKDGDSWKGVNSSKTFLSNKYKVECGTLKYDNHYDAHSDDKYTCTTDYHVGDLASGNVNAQMFGVLNLNETTLSYNVYTVNDDTVKLFDSLDVMKA